MSSIKTAFKSTSRKGMPLVLASSIASQFGCAGFPKPAPDELAGRPVELSMREAVDSDQRKLIGDALEGTVSAISTIRKRGAHSDIMIQRLMNGKAEERIDGISSWKGEEMSWIVLPHMEAVMIRVEFTDPDEITFKNAYYIGLELQNSLLPQMSSRFGGWTDRCEDFMPIRTRSRSNMVRSIEMLCQRKVPTRDGKK